MRTTAPSIGGFPQTAPQSDPDGWTYHRALAETTYADRHRTGRRRFGYASFQGQPDSTQLDWYPTLAAGSYTGEDQAAWSVTGNSNYVVLGGEFPSVNGTAQQGLVRFAVKSIAPNLVAPQPYTTPYPVTTTAVAADGSQTVTWPATWDPDNAVLTYSLYRNNSSSPVYQTTADSRFWTLPTMTWKATGLVTGSTPVYRLIVTDPFGNSTQHRQSDRRPDPLLKYTGTWSTTSDTNAYAGTLRTTSTNGASVSLTYSGDSIAIVAPTVSGGATANVSIDGSAPTAISFAPPAGGTAPRRSRTCT